MEFRPTFDESSQIIDVIFESDDVESSFSDVFEVEKVKDPYLGKYSVTPDVEPITLETKDKVMLDNVTVFKIPLWEVSNESGTTIYIGGEEIYHGIE